MSEKTDFVKDAINHLYGGKWADFGAGFGAHVIDDGVGFVVIYGSESDMVKCYAGVLTGLKLTLELCEYVATLNKRTQLGAYYIDREGETDGWSLIYFTQVRETWIDWNSDVSVQMLLDVLGNIPGFANRAIGYFDQETSIPISRWDLGSDSWWFLLLNRT